MFISLRSRAAMLAVVMAASLLIAPTSANAQPLTDFQPSQDFFQVPNAGVPGRSGWRGACLGIVESAITHWDTVKKNPNSTKRLATLSSSIIRGRSGVEGVIFLKEINRFAHNQSYSTTADAPRSGDRVADLVYADLARTRKPQVLGLDLPDGGRHAVLVYDAIKTNDKIVLRIGDPNYPDKDNFSLVYDTSGKDWTPLNFPPSAFPKGKLEPCFVRWDEKHQHVKETPNQNVFQKLMQEVEHAANNPTITASSIETKLGLAVPAFAGTPRTKRDLDRPAEKPNIQLAGTRWSDGKTTYRFNANGTFGPDRSAFPNETLRPGPWILVGDHVVEAKYHSDYNYRFGSLKYTFAYRITFQGNRFGTANLTQTSVGSVEGTEVTILQPTFRRVD